MVYSISQVIELGPVVEGAKQRMIPKCSVPSLQNRPLQFQSLNGLRQLAETRRFKVWLLDQFGVLHDGKQPYPASISTYVPNLPTPASPEWQRTWFLLSKVSSSNLVNGKVGIRKALPPWSSCSTWISWDSNRLLDTESHKSGRKNIAKTGAKMVIISNSSRRSSVTIEKVKSLGFDPSLFLGAITSGELTHQYLLRRDDPWFAALGRSCIHLTWSGRGAICLEGLDLQVVENVEEAEFVLAHGTEALGTSNGNARSMKLEDLERILELSAAKRIPMVVANPDYVTVEARDLRVMPGTLAAKYEKLGGEVKWMGKPYEIIYKSAMAMAGTDVSDCIAVGDSLHHDIKGANAAGIESVFITGGIHATELGLHGFGEVANSSSVQYLASKYDAYPSYVLPAFTW